MALAPAAPREIGPAPLCPEPPGPGRRRGSGPALPGLRAAPSRAAGSQAVSAEGGDLDRKRRQRARGEHQARLDGQTRELLAWLKGYFAQNPAPAKSYEALVMAEALRLAQDPAYAWRVKAPRAFLAEVLVELRGRTEETCRRLAETLADLEEG